MERWHGDHERSYEGSNFSNQEDLISQQHTCGWNLVPVDGTDFQMIGFRLTGLYETHTILVAC